MEKGRLLAFSDGVLAILITIMVLELKVPHGSDLHALRPLLPTFVSYLLSFIYIAIYWNNHHHMMHAVSHVNGKVLWANVHLLFWLSLVPFVTAWMGENSFTKWPIAMYGIVLLLTACAYTLLSRSLLTLHGKNTMLADAIGSDRKGWGSIGLYVLGIVLSFVQPWIGFSIYVIVAAIWFIPDRRIEKKIEEQDKKENEKNE